MKDYLKDYLAGRRREEFPEHSRGDEVPKVTKAVEEVSKVASGTFGTSQRVEYSENSEAQPAANSIDDPEISWRVEAMLPQIPNKGPIPFLVAREAIEPQAGCCLSCGDPLKFGDAYRCAACGRAANLALDFSLWSAKSSDESQQRID
jgi:hypothetical protein